MKRIMGMNVSEMNLTAYSDTTHVDVAEKG
jgi:hypothetical protein